jgi:UDP:flavonoid glycosyltransferase YjiC (YdhE family)
MVPVRVLFTTRGSAGHLGPLAPFGHACLRAGHEVLVAAQRQNEANVKRAELPFAPVDDPPPDEWMPLMGGFAELDVATANGLMISQFFAGIDLRAELPALRAITESWQPDVIVRESWEFGSTLVAELEGIPIVRVGLGLAEIEQESIELAAPMVDEARAGLGLPSDPAGERLAAAPYFTAIPEALEDPATRLPERTHRFRFGISEHAPALPDWWAGNDDPLVYLTFGSVTAGEHLPYFPALYRAAIEALADLRARVLVTVGDASRDLSELGEVPGNVRVETWVPQDAVAGHASVIVCHGGYGSTLGALAHGVPLVVMPLFSTDQWANGDAAARVEAGITLAGERGARNVLGLPGAEILGELPAAVEKILGDDAYRRGAERVADAISALPQVDDSVATLEGIAATARG